MFNRKNLVFVILALTLGVVGLSMIFSDIGPAESETRRITIAAIFFFLCAWRLCGKEAEE